MPCILRSGSGLAEVNQTKPYRNASFACPADTNLGACFGVEALEGSVGVVEHVWMGGVPLLVFVIKAGGLSKAGEIGVVGDDVEGWGYNEGTCLCCICFLPVCTSRTSIILIVSR